jgi:hypothetical protein
MCWRKKKLSGIFDGRIVTNTRLRMLWPVGHMYVDRPVLCDRPATGAALQSRALFTHNARADKQLVFTQLPEYLTEEYYLFSLSS